MSTEEGREMMVKEGREICATYEINGKNTFPLSAPDGSTREVVFKMSPESGSYTLDDLKAVVEQTLQEARNKDSEKDRSPDCDSN
jgi:hypothetical protein